MAEEKKQAKPIGPEDRGQEGGVESPVDLGDAPLVDLSDVGHAGRLSPEENPVALLEAEVASLRDQLLRTLAESENVRRRAQRDRQEGRKKIGKAAGRGKVGHIVESTGVPGQ